MTQPIDPDRRRMLLGGVAATGAAYVAPQVVRTAVAGAQTVTCYLFFAAIPFPRGAPVIFRNSQSTLDFYEANDGIVLSLPGTVVDGSVAAPVSLTATEGQLVNTGISTYPAVRRIELVPPFNGCQITALIYNELAPGGGALVFKSVQGLAVTEYDFGASSTVQGVNAVVCCPGSP